MSAETFAERLRRLRTECGFTVERLAQAIGVTHSVVRRAETGEHQIRAHRLPELARQLGVTTDYLLTGRDPNSALRRAILIGTPSDRLIALVRQSDLTWQRFDVEADGWTPEATIEMRRLWNDGVSSTQMERVFGCSHFAICAKARREGLTPRRVAP